VSKTVIEVASGLNEKRTKVSKLLADPSGASEAAGQVRVRRGCFVGTSLSVQGRTVLVLAVEGGCWRGAGGDRDIDVAVCAPAPAAQFPSR
jgi:hypothetical protein